MDISRITKAILKNCQKIEKMTPLTVKNGIFKKKSKVFNFLLYKVLSTQILPIYLSTNLSVCYLSVSLSNYQSICLPACRSFYLPVSLSTYLSVCYLSVSMSNHQYVCLPACLSVYLPLTLSIYLLV